MVPTLKLKTEEPIEMEEELHDSDKMVAMSVIENEIEVLNGLMKKTSGSEKEFYESKKGSLEFAKDVSSSHDIIS